MSLPRWKVILFDVISPKLYVDQSKIPEISSKLTYNMDVKVFSQVPLRICVLDLALLLRIETI